MFCVLSHRRGRAQILSIEGAVFWLDAIVSHSGLLRSKILRWMEKASVMDSAEPARDVDRILKQDCIVAAQVGN